MKLHLNQEHHINTFTDYTHEYVRVGCKEYYESVIVTPKMVIPWDIRLIHDLTPGHFESLLESRPEMILISTGLKQYFLHPAIYQPATDIQVSVECMNLGAMCRTFNILSTEGRQVIAAVAFPNLFP
jgi:uncharacterized protein